MPERNKAANKAAQQQPGLNGREQRVRPPVALETPPGLTEGIS